MVNTPPAVAHAAAATVIALAREVVHRARAHQWSALDTARIALDETLRSVASRETETRNGVRVRPLAGEEVKAIGVALRACSQALVAVTAHQADLAKRLAAMRESEAGWMAYGAWSETQEKKL